MDACVPNARLPLGRDSLVLKPRSPHWRAGRVNAHDVSAAWTREDVPANLLAAGFVVRDDSRRQTDTEAHHSPQP